MASVDPRDMLNLKSEKNRQHAQSLDGGDDNNDDTSTVIYFVVT